MIPKGAAACPHRMRQYHGAIQSNFSASMAWFLEKQEAKLAAQEKAYKGAMLRTTIKKGC